MYLKMASGISHGMKFQTDIKQEPFKLESDGMVRCGLWMKPLEGSSKDTTTGTVYGDENENENEVSNRLH